jgi:endonuclease YncB( thermonuclease family)
MLNSGKLAATVLFSLLILLLTSPSICVAKAIFGKVIEVKSADLVRLDYGAGQYDIRVAGIAAPSQEPFASQAKQFVSNFVLGKNVRLRFIARAPNGEMLGRLDTDDPVIGIKEVAVELVRAGLATVQAGFDGDLANAENEARQARRGLWAAAQPR